MVKQVQSYHCTLVQEEEDEQTCYQLSTGCPVGVDSWEQGEEHSRNWLAGNWEEVGVGTVKVEHKIVRLGEVEEGTV